MARRFAVGEGLVLLRSADGTLFAFNPVARQIWDMMEAGVSRDSMAASLSQVWQIGIDRARHDINGIFSLWSEHGLLDPVQSSVRPNVEAPKKLCSAPEEVQEWVCVIRGVAIGFSVPRHRGALVRMLFADLVVPSAVPQTHMAIAQRDGVFVLSLDGRERMRSPVWEDATGALFVAVAECLHPGVSWLALIHGGALARGDHGFALVGASGSGKSTLTAGLRAAGFTYLADDSVMVSAPDGLIVPWPLPQSVKPEGVKVLRDAFPRIEDAPRYVTKGMDARLLVPPRDVWDTAPLPLRTLFFPSFRENAQATHRRLTAFEALERLLADRVWLGDPITEAGVATFLGWLDRIPAYELIYGEQADAIRMVGALAP